MNDFSVTSLDHVSHSQIELFLTCPRCWEARYLKKVEEAPKGTLIFGGCYHKALEVYFAVKVNRGVGLPVADCIDCFIDAWNAEIDECKGRGQVIDWGKDDPNKLALMGTRLVEKYIVDIASNIVPASVEKRYSVKIAGVPFVGATDLELVPGGTDAVDVIDHKTAARAHSQSDIDKALQPSAHAFALGKELIYEQHIAIKTSTPRIQILRTHRSYSDIVWWLDLAMLVIAQMKSGIYPPNPTSWLCSPNYCNAWELCKGGNETWKE